MSGLGGSRRLVLAAGVLAVAATWVCDREAVAIPQQIPSPQTPQETPEPWRDLPTPLNQSQEIARLGEQARVHLARAEYDPAIALLDRILRQAPSLAVAYADRGWCYMAKGDREKALADVRKAVSLAPQNAAYHGMLGGYLAGAGLFDEAIAELDAALRLGPERAPFYFARGLANEGKGDLDAAIQDYTKALQLDPRAKAAYIKRGFIYRRTNRPERALENFDMAVKHLPADPHVYFLRGKARESLRQLDAALADHGRAIEIDPAFVDAYVSCGVIHAAAGRSDEAIEMFSKAVALKPESARLHFLRGAVHGQRGDYEAAVADLTKALERDDRMADAYAARARAHLSLGRNDLALVDATRALELEPGHVKARVIQAGALVNLGWYERAIAAANQALEQAPDNAMAYSNRGAARIELGEYAAAEADLRKAIALDPEAELAHGNLAVVYCYLGRAEEALTEFKKAEDVGPQGSLADLAQEIAKEDDGKDGFGSMLLRKLDVANETNAYRRRGATYREAGKIDLALADFNKAIEVDSDNPWNYAARSDALAVKGRFGEALDEANRAVECDRKCAEAYVARAWVHLCTKRYAEVIRDCSEALKLECVPWAYVYRGWAQFYAGRLERARSDAETALEQDASRHVARVLLFRVRAAQGTRDEAVAKGREDLKAIPPRHEARGLLEVLLGDTDPAALKDCLRADWPNYTAVFLAEGGKASLSEPVPTAAQDRVQAQARLEEAHAYHGKNRLDEARRAYREIIKDAPGTEAARDATIGLAYIEHATRGEAAAVAVLLTLAEEFEAKYRAEPRPVEELKPYINGIRLYSLVLCRTGRIDEAVKWGLMVWTIAPDDVANTNNLAWILAAERGERDRARKMIERCLRPLPNHPKLLDTAGWIAFLDGRYGEAENYLLASIKNGDHADARYHLGRLYEARDRLDDARAEYRKALALGLQGNEREDAKRRLGRLPRPQAP